MIGICYVAVALLLSSAPFAASAPPPASAPTGTAPAPPSATVPPISLDPNLPLWNASVVDPPQPIRGSLGANVIGPQDPEIVKQNPDLLAPPTTDHGSV